MKNTSTQYLVQTKGFKKQFSSEEDARKKFSALERKFEKNEQKYDIKLSFRDTPKGEWKLLDHSSVSENYYEE